MFARLRMFARIKLPAPEAVAVWIALGFAGYLLLDEWARWLARP
jgi:hypothetical protein